MRGIASGVLQLCRRRCPSSAFDSTTSSSCWRAQHAQVVGVDDHLLLHHPAHQVLAERGQAEGVAVRAGPVERQRPGREQRVEHVAGQRVAVRRRRVGRLRLVVVVRVRARAHLPEAPGLDPVAGVDDDAGRAAVAGHAAERVVELVDELHVAHAELVDLVELRSICAAVHSGLSSWTPQSNSLETSIPSTTASLPWLATRRAWDGVVTIRNQPLPGPPFCASM